MYTVFRKKILVLNVATALLLLSQPGTAGRLADKPLANSVTMKVPPNLMFVLDNSGSMGVGYAPDYVGNSYNQSNNRQYSVQVNPLYFDPGKTYSPPVDADGNPWPEMNAANTNSWTAVPSNRFLSAGNAVNLIQACSNSSYSNCTTGVSYPNGTYRYVQSAGYYSTPSTTLTWCKYNNGTTCRTYGNDDYPYVNSNIAFTAYRIARGDWSSGGAPTDFAEKMTNYANWYAYYRTRMQLMKTASGRAFQELGADFRVGFAVLNKFDNYYLDFKPFTGTDKANWFDRLYSISPDGGTPLKPTLSKIGSIYANKLAPGKPSPIQYSCQKNFTMLTTDGYWNSGDGYKLDGTTVIGDADGDGYQGKKNNSGNWVSSNGTLADVAAYYYKTDLRSDLPDTVKGGGNDTAAHQHMTTYTLGIGVNGTLVYSPTYPTDGSGDYYDITRGTKTWPDPYENALTTVDDLWHAAVTGKGKYFSAAKADTLYQSLIDTFKDIDAKVGSGAAAATSNLQPISGDNYLYTASYQTVKWDGDIKAKTIETSGANVGAISTAYKWSAKERLNAQGAAARNLYAYESASNLKAVFDTSASSTIKDRLKFDCGATRKIDQCDTHTETTARAALLDVNNLVNYLRGDKSKEFAGGAGVNANELYRKREAILGDIVNSQPMYIKTPPYSYEDAGYDAFRTAQTGKDPIVLAGVNDGYIHAFYAGKTVSGALANSTVINPKTSTAFAPGEEMWAYMPSFAQNELYRLVDDKYSEDHRFFVNGPSAVGDVYTQASGETNKSWRTIVAVGMGKGGKGIVVLDVTDRSPSGFKVLWQFTDAGMGYSFAKPVIGKLKSSQRWVVLLPSGYDETQKTGYLYVLDAGTGEQLAKISTGVSGGLSSLNYFAEKGSKNNSIEQVYAGDELGNLWRFDMQDVNSQESNFSSINAKRIAKFSGCLSSNFSGGVCSTRDRDQPITMRPEIGVVNGMRMIYVGTGRFLGVGDVSDQVVNTVYAVKDKLDANPSVVSLSTMVPQVLAAVNSTTREVTNPNPVDLTVKDGWYAELPDKGTGTERANVDMNLFAGVLMAATNVPRQDACTPDGDAWINYFDAKTGKSVRPPTGGIISSTKITGANIVGLMTVNLGGKNMTVITKSDDTHDTKQSIVGAGAFGGRRASWRELFQ